MFEGINWFSPKFLCGGALITSQHVLSAFHCVKEQGKCSPKDFSKGDFFVIVGRNNFTFTDMRDETLQKIPIIDEKHPKNAGLDPVSCVTSESHDFAMLILEA